MFVIAVMLVNAAVFHIHALHMRGVSKLKLYC